MVTGLPSRDGKVAKNTRLMERSPEGGAGEPIVRPFTPAAGFNDDWWSDFTWNTSARWFSLIDDASGDELVRVELVCGSDVGALYRPVPRNGYVEIELIETHAERRRRGWAREAIVQLQNGLPGPYAALAKEGAEPFWEGLGWTGFQHPTEPEHSDVLFIDERR